jgi:hypothetical protein
MTLYMLASRYDNKIPNDPEWIAKQGSLEVPIDLKSLEDAKFIKTENNDSIMLARCAQSAMPETEERQRREDTDSSPSAPPCEPTNLLGEPDTTKDSNLHKITTEIMSYWNTMERLPRCKVQSEDRRRKVKARWKKSSFRTNWRLGIQKLNESDFHTGGSSSGWVATIDWFIKSDTNFIKSLELNIPREKLAQYNEEIAHVEK